MAGQRAEAGCRRSSRRAGVAAIVISVLALLLAGADIHAQGFSDAPRHFRTSDGVRLAWHEFGPRGAAQTIVFVPGWCMPGWIWRAQVEAFAPRYRVIVFDPRGQGDSEIPGNGYDVHRRAADLAELLRAAQAKRAVLVGWSLAVLEALTLSREHPMDRIAGMVLVDNSVGEAEPPASRGRLIRDLRRDRESTLKAFVGAMFATQRPRGYLVALVDAARRMPLEASVRLLSYPMPREYWRESLYALPVPVLYVVTTRLRDQAAAVAARRPSIITHVLSGVGHALFVDDAPAFNGLLAQFMERLAGEDPL